ncbi:MAG: peptidoglycan DD-metalloendopeptidase family protein [Caulobacteraceae bacterium]
MRNVWMRASLIAIGVAGLAACQTPSPDYPVTRPVASAPAPAPAAPPASVDEALAAPPASPTTDVETRDLEPVANAPAREPIPVPAEEPPPPVAYTPPAYTPPPPAPPPQAAAPQAPPPRAAAPAPRPSPPVMIATGRVVTVGGQTTTYVVKSGDNLDALARKFDSTRRALADLNNLREPYTLRPGQRLKVPSAPVKAYVVASGDTQFAVARRFSINVSVLRRLNGLSANAGLRPGQKLTLPPNIRDLGPQRRPDAPATTTVAAASPPPVAPTTRPVSGPPAATAPVTPPPPVTRPYTPLPPTSMRPATPPPPPGVSTPPAQPMLNSSPPVSDSEIATLGRGRFLWPIRGDLLSGFGPKPTGQRNDGLDIRAPAGATVRAAAGGEVVYAGNQVPGFGNLVLIKHADGWVTAYAHLDKISVQMRQQVTQGQEIGQAGTSGGVSESQLHFEIRYAPSPADRARPIDPALVLPR